MEWAFWGSLPMVDSLFNPMAVRRFTLSLLLFLLSTSSSWPAQQTPARKGASRTVPAKAPTKNQLPNIVLITLDTTRADRMGFLGSTKGLTPNLDVIAKQGIVFPRAYSQVPLTSPSHITILTGTYPQFNHVNDFGMPLAKTLPYLPQILHDRGYRTAAFVGSVILD